MAKATKRATTRSTSSFRDEQDNFEVRITRLEEGLTNLTDLVVKHVEQADERAQREDDRNRERHEELRRSIAETGKQDPARLRWIVGLIATIGLAVSGILVTVTLAGVAGMLWTNRNVSINTIKSEMLEQGINHAEEKAEIWGDRLREQEAVIDELVEFRGYVKGREDAYD